MQYDFSNVELNHPYTRQELCKALNVEPKPMGKSSMIQLQDIGNYCILTPSGKGRWTRYTIEKILDTPEYLTWRRSKYTFNMRIILLRYLSAYIEGATLYLTYGNLIRDMGFGQDIIKQANKIKEQSLWKYYIGLRTYYKISDITKQSLDSLQSLGIITWDSTYVIKQEGKYPLQLIDEEFEWLEVCKQRVADSMDCPTYDSARFADYDKAHIELLNQLHTNVELRQTDWQNLTCMVTIHIRKNIPVREIDFTNAMNELTPLIGSYVSKDTIRAVKGGAYFGAIPPKFKSIDKEIKQAVKQFLYSPNQGGI